ncbi:hypothetical protein [Proteus alimentorum]|uniref:hypothetical protein n=1 Tax=Proteus alimentorum TaxID=1973495 RepID=UPI000C00079F|nr:hypothetical protein [Proteus alimentorum]
MEKFINECYKKIKKTKYSECPNSLGKNCLECSQSMYFDNNNINYQCKNKRLIYIVRYFPVHSSEIYNALYNLFISFNNEIKEQKKLVFASFGAGPGIDTYSFHKILSNSSNNLKCDSIIVHRVEACSKWTYLARKLMFLNTPKYLEAKYFRYIKDVTSDNIKLSSKFDILVLSYIISELDEKNIKKLIDNIKKNKNKISYILINDRYEDNVIEKMAEVMSSVAIEGYNLNYFNSEHCGFYFPDDIYSNLKPKVYRKSAYFIGKLK